MTYAKIKTFQTEHPQIQGIDLYIYRDNNFLENIRKSVAYYHPKTKEFFKVVNPGEHYLHKKDGYAMAVALLDFVKEHNCTYVVIIEKEQGKKKRELRSDPKDWEEHGEDIQFKDYEPQTVLPIQYFNEVNTKNDSEKEEKETKQKRLNDVNKI